MTNDKMAATFHPDEDLRTTTEKEADDNAELGRRQIAATTEQSVYLSISQGERTHVVSVSREGHWPGRQLPHITELIREVADQAIADILAAES